ncbi:hypothetical protein GCM10027348_39190 [Hymenobacter tenuis]
MARRPGTLLILRVLRYLLLLLLLAPAAIAQTLTEVHTDKARYNPGQAVSLAANIGSYSSGLSLVVQYYQTNTLLSTQIITPTSGIVSWTWAPPTPDFKGYLIGLTLKRNATTLSTASIGVDVSSDWARFPRYGFLSQFGPRTDGDMDVMIKKLNRYHLNGLQFYDWMDKHHRPLAGTPQAPAPSWNDLANRQSMFETIKGYIDRGHNKNINSLFYSLIYGAYPDAGNDGVNVGGWGLYRDVAHTNAWYNGGFPTSWEAAGLYIMNPGNATWRAYFLGEVGKVYDATNLHFDGWHIDQLGDWGLMYDVFGQQVQSDQAFGPFISAAKGERTTKRLVMNAVNQYGQPGIAAAPVDITYTEMWDGNEGYANLGDVIQTNERIAPGKRTVLAAYINKAKSGSAGLFNPASVLMADATIFAFGGAHIELGEHMLGNEYFPNSNLQMSATLQKDVTTYYDFAVAYENLLRDQGRQFNNVKLSGGTTVQAWPPIQGKVATVGSTVGGKQVFQLLNFTQAQTLNWRDNDQVQPVPTTLTNLSLSFPFSTALTKLWTASPDFNNGLPQQLTFTQTGGVVTLKLPQLKYWGMLVAETGTTPPAATATLKVYFKKPNTWATPIIHYWNTLPVTTNSTWPGVAMAPAPEVGTNWFSYTFAAGTTSANLVFSNNGDQASKTVDLARARNGYYDYGTSSWSDIPPISIYFKKPSAWGGPNLHHWSTQPQNSSSLWPGLVMSPAPELGGDWYSYTFPQGTTSTNLVFNNNGDLASKTPDLYRDKTGYYNYATATWDNTPTSARPALGAAAPAPQIAGLELEQNVPNPFTASTTLGIRLPTSGPVSLVVYDLKGRAVVTLLDHALLGQGMHRITLNGSSLRAGVYICRLTTGSGTLTTKMVKFN